MAETKNAAVLSPAVLDESPAEIVSESSRFETLDIGKDLTTSSSGWCSLAAVDDRDRVTLFNAVTTPVKLSDYINKQITVRHVYAEVIHVVNDETGEMVAAPRVVLIDDKGTGYQSVSTGIYNAVKRLMMLFGLPDEWAQPHKVEVQNVNLPNGRHTITLKVIS